MRTTLVVSVFLLLLAPCRALGQEAGDDASRTARARALFDEGRRLAAEEQWVAAAQRFRAAYALRRSPPIQYNLAVSLERGGHLLEAIEALNGVLSDGATDPDIRDASRTLLERTERRLGRLQIRVEDTPGDVVVVLDGERLPQELVGIAVPVDPGHHTTRLEVAGQVRDEQVSEVAEGEVTRVVLRLGADSPGQETTGSGVQVVPWPVTVGAVGLTLASVGVMTWSILDMLNGMMAYEENPTLAGLMDGQDREVRSDALLWLSVSFAGATVLLAVFTDWSWE